MIKEDILCSEQFDTSDVSSVGETSHKESVANHNSEADEFYIQLPAMRHDVLGLDHHRIMSQVIQLMFLLIRVKCVKYKYLINCCRLSVQCLSLRKKSHNGGYWMRIL